MSTTATAQKRSQVVFDHIFCTVTMYCNRLHWVADNIDHETSKNKLHTNFDANNKKTDFKNVLKIF